MRFRFLLCAIGATLLFSCKKFLDEKPDKALAIPATVDELQGLLDNNERMNRTCPVAGEASADNYYMTTADFNALTNESSRSLYTWGEEITYNNFPNDWLYAYQPVYHANIVLETLEKMVRDGGNAVRYDNAKGSALLFRAKCFFVAALTWSKAYGKASAATDLGIPLRLSSDFNETSFRPSVQAVYDRVLADLQAAIPLLPVTPLHPMRPSKPAAYALVSRVYMAMQDYEKGGAYADSALQLVNTLVDYNSLNAATAYPFLRFNPEVIMHFSGGGLPHVTARTDSGLYNSYLATDLRKALYFKANGDGSYNFRGSYDGTFTLFTGIATDELYLARAECRAKLGATAGALSDLNTLLAKRFKTGTFVPVTAATAGEALEKIRAERRKELIGRDLRWMDVKRWNKDGAAISLKRVVAGTVYDLPPNDPRFALPIPASVIALTGMPQNPR